MKLKMTLLLTAIMVLGTSSVYANTSGEALFDAKCASCHAKTRPSDISTLVAPPIMGVVRHVKMRYASKEEVVGFIVDYTLNPQKNKSVCQSDKLKRFGLMPSQKGNVTKEELSVISAWIYDNFGNTGQGGSMGQGMGKGQGYGKACNKQ